MFSSASIVQHLPLHVVESIVDYARTTHDVDYKTDKLAVLSIIHSCQLWRSVFLRKACGSILFRFGTSDSPEFTFVKCPSVISPLSYPAVQHIRHLSIDSNSWRSVMDGSLLTWMLETGISDLLFPTTESLKIRIFDANHSSVLPDESIIAAVHNIEAFFKHIRSMVPSVKSADIVWSDVVFSNVNQNLVSLITGSVTNILRGLHKFRFNQCTFILSPTQYNPAYTSGMTHLDLAFSFGYTWLINLIRHNAGTLVSLKTYRIYKSYFESLLCDINSEPIVYPFLKLLRLDEISNLNFGLPMTDTTFEFTGNDTAHFPLLESFHITGEFPFIRNVFMPGKNTTLKHLTAGFYNGRFADNNTVFQRYVSTQFCDLRSISVDGASIIPQSDDGVFDSQIEFLRSILSHSKNVQKLAYFGYMDKCRFFREAQTTTIFRSLRVLAIHRIHLPFSDIVLLLQNATLLESLECGVDKKAPRLDGVKLNNLPSYISSMRPLNKWFKTIKINPNHGIPTKYIAKIAILLAIGCPRLSAFFCRTYNNKCFYEEIDNISKTKPFFEFTEQCKFISSRFHY